MATERERKLSEIIEEENIGLINQKSVKLMKNRATFLTDNIYNDNEYGNSSKYSSKNMSRKKLDPI
jgi:hypothetical protein